MNTAQESTLRSLNLGKTIGLALICFLVAGVPAHAKPKNIWKTIGGVLSTLGGVLMGTDDNTNNNAAVGPLIGLQGTLLSAAVQASSDPVLTLQTEIRPGYAGTSGPEICADGSLTCSAAQALLALEVPAVEISASWTQEEIAFATAANRVIEDGNLFARHTREGAPLDLKKQDLRLMAASLEEAADAYDRLGLSLELAQSDIDSFQAQIAGSGLPDLERQFWESTNLTADEIEAVSQFLAETHLELGTPAVSMSRILHEEAATLVPANQ